MPSTRRSPRPSPPPPAYVYTLAVVFGVDWEGAPVSSVTDDSAEETAEDPYAGLDHVFRTYVVNGADGIARLYEDLRRHRRDPLLDRFCTELHLVLTDPA